MCVLFVANVYCSSTALESAGWLTSLPNSRQCPHLPLLCCSILLCSLLIALFSSQRRLFMFFLRAGLSEAVPSLLMLFWSVSRSWPMSCTYMEWGSCDPSLMNLAKLLHSQRNVHEHYTNGHYAGSVDSTTDQATHSSVEHCFCLWNHCTPTTLAQKNNHYCIYSSWLCEGVWDHR